jgi:hypothetical protein
LLIFNNEKVLVSNSHLIKVILFRSLEREIVLGQIAGHRRPGKPRSRWLDSIKDVTGLCLEALKETVQDRKKMAQAGGGKVSE